MKRIYMVPLGIKGRKMLQPNGFSFHSSFHSKTSSQHFRIFCCKIEPKVIVKEAQVSWIINFFKLCETSDV